MYRTQLEGELEPEFATPLDDPVEQVLAGADKGGARHPERVDPVEAPVPEGQADGVEAQLGDFLEVLPLHPGLTPRAEAPRRLLLAEVCAQGVLVGGVGRCNARKGAVAHAPLQD